MEKKQFVTLLYLCGVVPIMYAISTTFVPQSGWIWFWLCNIIALVVFAIVFSTNTNPVTQKRKKNSLIILWWGAICIALAWWIIQYSNHASQRLYEEVFAPHTISSGISLSEIITTGDNNNHIGSSGNISLWTTTTGKENGQPIYPKTSSTGETQTIDTFQSKENIKNMTPPSSWVATTVTSSLILPNKGTLNYAQVIPYLVSHYKLKSTGKAPSFKNISPSNSTYSTFVIAANKGMIGNDINPASTVSCNTYLVLKGIAADWKVDYKAWNPFGAYRTMAFNKWEINGCTAGAFVTKATL
jgi:hypothetical protein